MARKKVEISGKDYLVEGVGPDDPYFLGLSDDIDSEFAELIGLLLEPDAVAFDIGANIGVTSLLLSRHLEKGQVFSFEPSPSVFPILQRNLEVNRVPNVVAQNVALGASPGTLGFIGDSAYGHLVSSDADGDVEDDIMVAVEKVDDLVAKFSPDRLDLLKIDVEGFEPDVLDGARETETRFKPLYYMEFNGWCLSAHRRVNPFDFAQRIVREFQFVFEVTRQGEVLRLGSRDANTLLHRNLVLNGCVSNILATNSEERVTEKALSSLAGLTHAKSDTETSQASSDLDEMKRALEHARKYPWKYLRSAVASRMR